MSAALNSENVPGFWMNEVSGILAPAVKAYLRGEPLDVTQVSYLRAYLRQWIAAPGWAGHGVDMLRESIDGLTDRASIAAWVDAAIDIGIDPF